MIVKIIVVIDEHAANVNMRFLNNNDNRSVLINSKYDITHSVTYQSGNRFVL